MKGFRQLAIISIRLYLREPVATFFTIVFPPLLVLLFGAMYGNDPADLFDGYGSMDISMPGYTAMILGTVGFMGVPITISSNRESGVLRRFQATPMHPLSYILADVISNLAATLLGMTGLVTVGWLLYQVQFEGNLLSVTAAFLLGGLAMFSIGYLIASVAPGARTAQVVGMVIFYPMLFLSGAGMPLEILPESIQRVSEFLPLTYVVRLLRGMWFGGAWSEYLLETAVLGGILLICTIVAGRYFRWE